MKILLSFFFFSFILLAQNNTTSQTGFNSYLGDNNETNKTINPVANVKILYMHYQDVPKRIIKGEIFSVTLRVLSTESDFYELNYIFENARGVKILNEIPFRQEKGKFYYDTFHFLAQSTGARLPDFKAYIVSFDGTEHRPTTLKGKNINVVALNPRKNFSNIIADSFELEEYKTTSYDSNHNIVVFVATAHNSDISAFHLQNVFKQGVESLTNDIEESRIIYFIIIQKEIENFKFSYFNLLDNKFQTIKIPIVVNDDSVTTQTDLKPKDQSREKLKMLVAIAVALILLMIIVWSRKYIYTFLLILPIAYAIYTYTPSTEVCIRPDTNIYLLPVKNGTIFQTTQGVTYLMKEGSIKNYTKVKLQDNKIGWIKHENLCSY